MQWRKTKEDILSPNSGTLPHIVDIHTHTHLQWQLHRHAHRERHRERQIERGGWRRFWSWKREACGSLMCKRWVFLKSLRHMYWSECAGTMDGYQWSFTEQHGLWAHVNKSGQASMKDISNFGQAMNLILTCHYLSRGRDLYEVNHLVGPIRNESDVEIKVM